MRYGTFRATPVLDHKYTQSTTATKAVFTLIGISASRSGTSPRDDKMSTAVLFHSRATLAHIGDVLAQRPALHALRCVGTY
jgi:hypothetical protein